MSDISLKNYIKQEIEYMLDYCEEVENLAEGFEMDICTMYKLIENIEEDVAESMNNNEYYQATINGWIKDEIKDAIKDRILKAKGE